MTNIPLLGLAKKAGKVKSGSFATERSIQVGEACLVIIAEDASDNTRKKFVDKCTYYDIPYIVFGNSEELGHMIGNEARKVLSIEDEGFANSILKKLQNLNGGN